MTEVDPSLIALETLDRTSPELWPEPSKYKCGDAISRILKERFLLLRKGAVTWIFFA